MLGNMLNDLAEAIRRWTEKRKKTLRVRSELLFQSSYCIKIGSGRHYCATREVLLSEAGFEKLFRTQNWVRRSKLFCR